MEVGKTMQANRPRVELLRAWWMLQKPKQVRSVSALCMNVAQSLDVKMLANLQCVGFQA